MAVICEAAGWSTLGPLALNIQAPDEGNVNLLEQVASPEQKARWMPGITAGETITAVAVTEPDAGSDVAGIRTRAVQDGSDWVLNGTKMFITNGVHADLCFVAARTDPDARGSRGITIFALERGTPGFGVGRALDKTGWLCSDTAELVLDDVRLPDANVLGEVNRGFYAVMRNFQNERIVLGAVACSEAQTALDLTLEHVRQRRAFGGVLWDRQAIRQRLADCQSRIEAGRQLLYHAARLDAAGLDCVREVSMVKAYCGELVNRVLYDCVQFHGGMGYMRETPVERMSRDARVQAIGGGATEVMLEEVAKRM
jgi:acyl-CoA dehydrogenase